MLIWGTGGQAKNLFSCLKDVKLIFPRSVLGNFFTRSV